MRGRRDLVKLLDFGVAKLIATADGVDICDPLSRPPQTMTGQVVGTPDYISPEQARAKPVDGKTDVYALGVIAYEMILGRRPFEADNTADVVRMHLSEAPPRAAALWPEIPSLLDELLATHAGEVGGQAAVAGRGARRRSASCAARRRRSTGSRWWPSSSAPAVGRRRRRSLQARRRSAGALDARRDAAAVAACGAARVALALGAALVGRGGGARRRRGAGAAAPSVRRSHSRCRPATAAVAFEDGAARAGDTALSPITAPSSCTSTPSTRASSSTARWSRSRPRARGCASTPASTR